MQARPVGVSGGNPPPLPKFDENVSVNAEGAVPADGGSVDADEGVNELGEKVSSGMAAIASAADRAAASRKRQQAMPGHNPFARKLRH